MNNCIFPQTIQMLWTNGIGDDIGHDLFEIEVELFKDKYKCCPSTYEEFIANYKDKMLFIVSIFFKQKLVGVRIFEKITEEYMHSLLFAVKKQYQKKGLGSLICFMSASSLSWYGYNYVSSWTHESLSVVNVLAKYAPVLSYEPIFSPKERELLNQLEIYRSKESGFYGKRRLVPDYYEMTNGEIGKANFNVHKLVKLQ